MGLVQDFIGPVYGKFNQAGKMFELQFFFEVFAVGADGLDTEMETIGNFLGGKSLANESQDFQLAVGEDVQR